MNDALNQFLKKFPANHDFKPIAYYQKNLDQIVVQVEDCSFYSVSTGPLIDILQAPPDNHPIGFTLHGIRHFLVSYVTNAYSRIRIIDLVKAMSESSDIIFPQKILPLLYGMLAGHDFEIELD